MVNFFFSLISTQEQTREREKKRDKNEKQNLSLDNKNISIFKAMITMISTKTNSYFVNSLYGIIFSHPRLINLYHDYLQYLIDLLLIFFEFVHVPEKGFHTI